MTARVMRSGVAPMTGNLQMGSNKITGLANGSDSTDAVTRGQMDTAIAAAIDLLRARTTVRVRDTTDSNPASSGYNNGQSIGGVTVATGDYILRDSASNQSRNGVWVVSASGAASRAAEYDSYDEHPGATIAVQEGTYADRVYLCTSNKGGTINSTAIVFVNEALAPVLDGLSVATSTQTVATDTILSGIGKLQGQIGKFLEISGFRISNNGTDATNDIDIASGRCWDSTGTVLIVLGSGITKRLDADFSAGTGNGMRHTTAIANTTYHLWAICDANGGNVDVFAGTNASDPSGEGGYPSGYKYRYIGSILRESAAIVQFSEQPGGLFHRADATVLSTSSTFSYTLTSLLVPVGISVRPILSLFASAGTAAVHNISLALGVLSGSDIDIVGSGNSQDFGGSWPPVAVTNTSGQIAMQWTRYAGSGGAITVYIHGWINPKLLLKVF